MKKTGRQLIGILGGTFDPIHLGHLHIALAILNQIPLQLIKFIPCYKPVHRDAPGASPADRVNMINLALKGYPKLALDEREIKRQGPSYMIDTLTSLREDYPDASMSLILGRDAYLTINTWKDWNHLLDYAHFLVINRPGATAIQSEPRLQKHETHNIQDLLNSSGGYIYALNIPPCSLAGTTIRQNIRQRDDSTWDVKSMLPEDVYEYIKSHHLYE